jgi:ribose transport system substrate-binding protein
MDRERGFEETLAAESPGIRIVASEYGKTTVATALAVVEDLLAKTPQFDGIFACNESTAVGTLRALQNHRKAGEVRFVGFDTSPTLVEGLEAGQIDALIAQNPFRMGYEGVKAAIDTVRGNPVEKRIDTGVAVVTKANMAEPEIAQLLDIELVKKWLE